MNKAAKKPHAQAAVSERLLREKQAQDNLQPKVLHSPNQTADTLDIGITTLYALIKSGDLKAIKIGRLTKIPQQSIDEFIAAAPSASRNSGAHRG